jgi:hypothetical protein
LQSEAINLARLRFYERPIPCGHDCVAEAVFHVYSPESVRIDTEHKRPELAVGGLPNRNIVKRAFSLG